jgi:hypothetical protein
MSNINSVYTNGTNAYATANLDVYKYLTGIWQKVGSLNKAVGALTVFGSTLYVATSTGISAVQLTAPSGLAAGYRADI